MVPYTLTDLIVSGTGILTSVDIPPESENLIRKVM